MRTDFLVNAAFFLNEGLLPNGYLEKHIANEYLYQHLDISLPKHRVNRPNQSPYPNPADAKFAPFITGILMQASNLVPKASPYFFTLTISNGNLFKAKINILNSQVHSFGNSQTVRIQQLRNLIHLCRLSQVTPTLPLLTSAQLDPRFLTSPTCSHALKRRLQHLVVTENQCI